MCGIAAYVGYPQMAKKIIVDALGRLEYRGYDAAGVALQRDGELSILKEIGSVVNIRVALEAIEEAQLGIGHTRWAKYGEPHLKNAHPHESESGRFALVHNGMIDNAQTLREQYIPHIPFRSTTDAEVIVHLIEHFVECGHTVQEAFIRTIHSLRGDFAIACIDKEDGQTLYVATQHCPLWIGVSEDARVAVSDIRALQHPFTRAFALEDGDIGVIQATSHSIFQRDGTVVHRPYVSVEFDTEVVEKGNYSHYMVKEMTEQSDVLCEIARRYMSNDGSLTVDESIVECLRSASRLVLIGAGSSYHAALIGKRLFERISQLPTDVYMSSEYVYNPPLLVDGTVAIVISHSGETGQTYRAVESLKKQSIPVIALTNHEHSIVSRAANYRLDGYVSSEIAVTATKSYISQIGVLTIAAAMLERGRGMYGDFDVPKQFAIAAFAMQSLFHHYQPLRGIATRLLADQHVLIVGHGLDYAVAQEAALKLKEVSYLHAEGYASGELLHGSLALIQDGVTSIFLITNKRSAQRVRHDANIVKARGGHVLIFAMEGLHEKGDAFVIPRTHPILSPFVSIMPFQWISYYIAMDKGFNVDRPRHIVKTIT